MATQDRVLQTMLRKVPGRCLLYLHESTPILEAPSEASKKWVTQKAKKTLTKGCDRVEQLKEKEGLTKNNNNPPPPTIVMKKHPKNPNPLSCKKSKKIRMVMTSQIQKNSDKPKRKRIKIPTHVKEILLNKTSS